MTRATWPLSRDAVEAAAREMYEHDVDEWVVRKKHDWDLLSEDTRLKQSYRAMAAKGIRSALKAWKPNEAQAQALIHSMPVGDGQGQYPVDELLAAVRTEAAE